MIPALGNQRPRNAFRRSIRGVLKPWSVLPVTCQTPVEVLEHGDSSRRSPVPVQPAHSGRPSYGPDGNPRPPGWCLRGTSPGAASTFGVPLRPALALPHFRTPLEAPLIGQDTTIIRAPGTAGIGIHSQVRER